MPTFFTPPHLPHSEHSEEEYMTSVYGYWRPITVERWPISHPGKCHVWL